ncbi:rRNA maturation RNase YbeY [Uruburuella testudinis]|uniref:Endoribonuclease YbeY n=1 Tax=Uruburuella testudinis TaxID=1282863 RepID=A0ABY4DUB6_9NEIS|nr:rRNA maturation RNase YbeY [Uruburuella testudinis]UOO82451.1 rRNA maturation RNase YbeY [Uruburuella testudinis]
MKSAKRYPFLKLQQQRFTLHFSNESATAAPPEHSFYRWVWQALKNEYRRADISIILLDEHEARAYNRDYRGKDYATNVLSFALNEGEAMFAGTFSDGLYGDLVICPQVVLKEAAEQGKTPEQHFAHLTVHGILHLMGYDHIEDEEAEIMEALEIRLLNQLAYPNPYLQDEN